MSRAFRLYTDRVLYPRKNKKVDGLCGKANFVKTLKKRRPATGRRIPKSERETGVESNIGRNFL